MDIYFFDNENSQLNIYYFMLAQQDYEKKLIKIDFFCGCNFKFYLFDYLRTIKSVNDGKYDMLTEKNSKLLFYSFNKRLEERKNFRTLKLEL